MSNNSLEVDILDIMYSAKRGFSIADLLLQINNIYMAAGKGKVEQEDVEKVLNELTEKGYLKKFKVGIVDNWKITEEGIDFFESL